MKEHEILLFTNSQCHVLRLFWHLRLIKPISAYSLEHPITKKVEGFQQVYESKEWVNSLIFFICDLLLDKRGLEAINRLEHCGYIREE